MSQSNKMAIFDSPIMSSKIKSANTTLFPEGILGYLVGPTLALLANSILSGYYNRYMTDVLDMAGWASAFFTWLPVISVIFVVLGNIIVGRLMDNMKTKAGKARPLILLSVPVAIIALLILFVLTPFANGEAEKSTQIFALVTIAIGYNLWFAIAYPFYYTPHASLVNLSTRSSKDRSLLATISNATALAAMGICSMVLPFFLGLLFVGTGEFNEQGIEILDQVASYEHWKIFVIALIVITAVGALVEFFFTRERVTEETADIPTESKKAVPIGEQVKICFSDKFWWIMIVFFLLYQLGGMLKNVSQLYFCSAMFSIDGVYSTAVGGTFQGTLSIIGAIPTALGMVIAWPLSNKIGKGKAIFFGAIVSVIGGAIGLIVPDNFVVVVISFVIKALGSTPAMYLSLALLGDVLDHQEAMNGVRTDGLTMTIYGAIMAGMTGITTGILNIILSSVGYTAATCASAEMQALMPWIFIGGETICYGIIFLIFIFMGVEKFGKFDHKAIVADQKAAAEAEGREYPPKMTPEEEAEKAEAEKAKAAQEEKAAQALEAKLAKMTAEEKAAYEAKKAADEKKQAEEDAATLAEFNKLRKKHNRPEID